jgi:hypothetical protein
MNDDRTSLPPDVEGWLEVAARDLCDDARERIRREIADHYRSALEAATEAGAPVPAAHLQAMRVLGDPAEVRRGLRRTNLTRFQAALVLEHRGRPSRRVLVLRLALLALGVGFVAAFAPSPAGTAVGVVALGLIVLAIAVMHALAPWAYRRGRIRTAILASAVSQWLFYCALCVGLPYCTGKGPVPYAQVFYAAVLVLLLALFLPLLGKVRRLDADEATLP